MKKILLILPALPVLFSVSSLSAAELLPAPFAQGAVIGQNGSYLLGPKETLVELAPRVGIGYQSLVRANPRVDPWVPGAGTEIVLPMATILPGGAGPGITINLAELKLYHLWQEGNDVRVRVYPVGIGMDGSNTPEGEFFIKSKLEKPTWYVPASIREKRPGFPAVVPPGPNNPLGEYWLELSIKGFGIHGTNEPLSVGRRVSHGCLRLYAGDIRELYSRVDPGTPVRIVYQPIKVGVSGRRLMVEIHPDYLGRHADPLEEILRLEKKLDWRGEMDWPRLLQAVEEARGIPVPVSRPPAAESPPPPAATAGS